MVPKSQFLTLPMQQEYQIGSSVIATLPLLKALPLPKSALASTEALAIQG